MITYSSWCLAGLGCVGLGLRSSLLLGSGGGLFSGARGSGGGLGGLLGGLFGLLGLLGLLSGGLLGGSSLGRGSLSRSRLLFKVQ